MLVGFKLGEQVFDYPWLESVVWGGRPYGRSILDDIHEIKIDRIGMRDDKVGAYLCGELGPDTAESWSKDAVVVGTSWWGQADFTVDTLLEVSVDLV